MKFNEKIKLILKGEGRSQGWLARSVAASNSTISNIVNGADTTTNVGIGIAKTLGVSADWLFDDSQPWPPRTAQAHSPFPIHPFPPNGLTWAELQQAISEFVTRRAFARQAELQTSPVAPACAAHHGDNTNGTDAAKAGEQS